MDSRQNISPLMGPPGYPHIPPISTTVPNMTGDCSHGSGECGKMHKDVLADVAEIIVEGRGAQYVDGDQSTC